MTLLLDIVTAAKHGDSDEVARLAQSNPFVPVSGSIEPALLAACEFGQLSVVRVCVLDLKCNPNCVDRSGRSPLHMAVIRKGNGKVAVSILKFLVLHGAQIRKSVLHVCANDMAVLPLVELGADVNARSVDGLTPIAAALAADREEVVNELIRAGCRVYNELLFSAKSCSAIQALVRAGLDVNCRDSEGLTPLQRAVERNDRRLARSLLEANADPSVVSRTSSVDESLKPATASSGGITRAASSDRVINTDWLKPLEEVLVIVAQQAADDELIQDLEDCERAEVLLQQISENMKIIKNKHKKAASGGLCVVCKARPKATVLMPCKHMCCCARCAAALINGGSWDSDTCRDSSFVESPKCPICRQVVKDSVNVYT